ELEPLLELEPPSFELPEPPLLPEPLLPLDAAAPESPAPAALSCPEHAAAEARSGTTTASEGQPVLRIVGSVGLGNGRDHRPPRPALRREPREIGTPARPHQHGMREGAS